MRTYYREQELMSKTESFIRDNPEPVLREIQKYFMKEEHRTRSEAAKAARRLYELLKSFKSGPRGSPFLWFGAFYDLDSGEPKWEAVLMDGSTIVKFFCTIEQGIDDEEEVHLSARLTIEQPHPASNVTLDAV